MKSTDVPKFDRQWWSKNKGLLVPETGFGKLLGAFEVAEDQMDYAKQIHALDEIGKKIPEMARLAAKDKDTVTVLNKYPNLIRDKKAEIVKKQDAEKAKAAAAATAKPLPPRPTTVAGPKPLPTPPKQKIEPLEKLWSKDFALEVGQRLPWLQMKGYIVELKVNGDVLDLLAKQDGGATAGLMIGDAQKICAKYAAEFVKNVENLPGSRSTSMQEIQKKAQEQLMLLHPKLVAEVKAVPAHRWEKFQRDKPMWREYKIETGASVAIGSLTLVVGALSIAAAVPTMGATLPLAVVGTARGLFQLCTTVANAVRSVESDQKELVSSIEILTKAYLDTKKEATTRMKVQEISAAVLKGILGADVPLFIESLPKCNAAYKRWKPKVASLRIDHGLELKHALDLMPEIDKLEAEMKKSQNKKAVELFGKIKKLRELVTKGLDEVHDLGGRIGKAEEVEPKLKEGLEELNSANPNYVKVFSVLFPAAVSIGLAAASGGIEIKHAETALELAKSSLVLSEEILHTVQEAVI